MSNCSACEIRSNPFLDPWRLLGIVANIAAAVLVWVAVQLSAEVNANSEKIRAIETWQAATSANRFTSGDGLAVWKEIASVREHLAVVEADETPPAWTAFLVDRLDRVEVRLDRIEELIRREP